MAQTSTTLKAHKKELRKDIRERKTDKKEVIADIKAKDKAAAKAGVQELKVDRKEIKQETVALKAKGAKHHEKKAHMQIHEVKKHHG